jgi:hypothetical protein
LPRRHYCFEEIERKYLEIEKEDSSKPTNVAQYQREIFAGLKLKEVTTQQQYQTSIREELIYLPPEAAIFNFLSPLFVSEMVLI